MRCLLYTCINKTILLIAVLLMYGWIYLSTKLIDNNKMFITQVNLCDAMFAAAACLFWQDVTATFVLQCAQDWLYVHVYAMNVVFDVVCGEIETFL
jgi:hypothetical protein